MSFDCWTRLILTRSDIAPASVLLPYFDDYDAAREAFPPMPPQAGFPSLDDIAADIAAQEPWSKNLRASGRGGVKSEDPADAGPSQRLTRGARVSMSATGWSRR